MSGGTRKNLLSMLRTHPNLNFPANFVEIPLLPGLLHPVGTVRTPDDPARSSPRSGPHTAILACRSSTSAIAPAYLHRSAISGITRMPSNVPRPEFPLARHFGRYCWEICYVTGQKLVTWCVFRSHRARSITDNAELIIPTGTR